MEKGDVRYKVLASVHAQISSTFLLERFPAELNRKGIPESREI